MSWTPTPGSEPNGRLPNRTDADEHGRVLWQHVDGRKLALRWDGPNTDSMAAWMQMPPAYVRAEQLPAGPKPRCLHDEERIAEIQAAIDRYRDADRPVPSEWLEELEELTGRLLERPMEPEKPERRRVWFHALKNKWIELDPGWKCAPEHPVAVERRRGDCDPDGAIQVCEELRGFLPTDATTDEIIFPSTIKRWLQLLKGER